MTVKEDSTLQEFIVSFNDYVEEDRAWKENIEKKLNPLVEQDFEAKVLAKFGRTAWKLAVAVVGFIGAIVLIFTYFKK